MRAASSTRCRSPGPPASALSCRPGLADTVARVRAATDVPVAVGFGISTPDHARAVAEIADGVIVGSRVVRAAGEGGAPAVGQLVGELAEALRA